MHFAGIFESLEYLALKIGSFWIDGDQAAEKNLKPCQQLIAGPIDSVFFSSRLSLALQHLVI